MNAYFLSDIHLQTVNEHRGRVLLKFLQSLLKLPQTKDQHLFLLGDIFDWWLSDHEVFIKKFQDLIQPIRELRARGWQIYFFEGNHDLHVHPFWAEQLGVHVFTKPAYFQLGPWSVRCEHGDEINLDDKSYLRLRAFLRNPIVEKIGHILPGKMWYRVGEAWSAHSRQRSSAPQPDKETRLVKMIRHHAERAHAQKPFQYIISGHMHVRDEFVFVVDHENVHSINLGSWFSDIQVLHLTERGHEWLVLA